MATSDSRWDQVTVGRVYPRTLLSKRFKSEEERLDALRIDVIRAWRLDRSKKGLPSGLNDYFIAKDICPTCRGNGIGSSFTCFRCAGSGWFFAREDTDPGPSNVAYAAGYAYACGYHD